MEAGGSVDFSAHVLNLEVLAHFVEELLGGEAVEIANHAVVVDDLEVACGEGHGHEVVVFLVALVVGVVLCLFGANEGSGGAAVVAVGDVEVGDFVKLLGDGVDSLGVFDEPESVAEAVVGNEVVLGLAGGNVADDLLELLVVGESEEHRLDVGVVATHVFHAVFLLVAAGELMLFDSAFHIIVHPSGHYEAILGASVHCLGVDIVVLLVVLNEPAVFLELLEVLHSFVVDFGVVLVETGFKVDFGLDDMIKRFGVALGFLACLFRVEHVVGTRHYLFDHLLRRTDTLERFYFCHCCLSFCYVGIKLVLSEYYGLLAVGTDGDDADFCTELLLDKLHIVGELPGEVGRAATFGHGLLPSGHLDVDGLYLLD